MSAQAARKLFGTDGVRGVANRELTPELALEIGRALGAGLGAHRRVVIGRDTRRSGPMLEAALAAGLAAAGVDVQLVGVLPTPAIAEAVPALGAAAGAVISASHNPFSDNGIKLIGPDGFKLADADEAEVERRMADPAAFARPVGADLGDISTVANAAERYITTLIERFPTPLEGISVVLDCANGATCVTAPDALRRLGARASVINIAPDGLNINDQCGSTPRRRCRRRCARAGTSSASPSMETAIACWPSTPTGYWLTATRSSRSWPWTCTGAASCQVTRS